MPPTDSEARNLFTHDRQCPTCAESVSLADQLIQICPHCHRALRAGLITFPESYERLRALLQRRIDLGLTPPEEESP